MIKDTIKRTITCDHYEGCDARVQYEINIFEAEDSGYLRMGYDGAEVAKDWSTYGACLCPAHKVGR